MSSTERRRVIVVLITSLSVLSCQHIAIHQVLLIYAKEEMYQSTLVGILRKTESPPESPPDLKKQMEIQGRIYRILEGIGFPIYYENMDHPPEIETAQLSEKLSKKGQWELWELLTDYGIPYQDGSGEVYHYLTLESRLSLYIRR